MSIIQLENISQQFGRLSVLDSINLKLEKGEVLGLFGHNGAGKTTSMKMILGLLKPTSGQVRVFGQDPFLSDFNHYRYRIGFLPENVSFYQQLTGKEVLHFFAKLKRVSLNRCKELLKQVGLTEAAERKVKTYSKGMKQRLGLAQAILTEPSLLLLDEPTVGLDPIATQDFYQIVDQLKNNGCSIILCSHVLPGVEKHIDKVAILSQGKLAAFGCIPELRKQTSLTTQINFSGCFDISKLQQALGVDVGTQENGSFSLKIQPEYKLKTVQTLLAQPGLQDLDTLPPSLEQLYRHFVVGKPSQGGQMEQSISEIINSVPQQPEKSETITSKTGEQS